MKRQALHAASLRLQHPVTGKAFQLIGETRCVSDLICGMLILAGLMFARHTTTFAVLCFSSLLCCTVCKTLLHKSAVLQCRLYLTGFEMQTVPALIHVYEGPVEHDQISDEGCCAAAPLPADMSEALQILNIAAPDSATLQALLGGSTECDK